VAPATAPAAAPAQAQAPAAARPADVSPLAAVIGIALLGGMLLIGVLIGRGSANNDPAPAPVVQVGDPAAATTTTTTAGSTDANADAPTAVASEWPPGTDGFTIQLTTVSKKGATTETVDAAKQTAVADGAAAAGVLDSDLYASLPPGNYVIYSGVYTDRKSAESALADLAKSFPKAAVVEVSNGGQPPATGAPPSETVAPGSGDKAAAPPGSPN
jgi:hypothetical protein